MPVTSMVQCTRYFPPATSPKHALTHLHPHTLPVQTFHASHTPHNTLVTKQTPISCTLSPLQLTQLHHVHHLPCTNSKSKSIPDQSWLDPNQFVYIEVLIFLFINIKVYPAWLFKSCPGFIANNCFSLLKKNPPQLGLELRTA